MFIVYRNTHTILYCGNVAYVRIWYMQYALGGTDDIATKRY